MAQHDYDISNQSFPAFRSDLNSVLEAINTSNSGTSRPSSAVNGTIWLDTTNATTPTLKLYDGTDDISLATFDYSANTVNWLDSTVSADLVNDLSPQLGAMLDVNGNAIGNGTEELIKFSETASAVNEVTVTNSATGNAPEISATGDDTNIDFKLTPKGTGKLILDGLNFPTADGTTGQFLKTDGSGNLSFDDAGGGDIVKLASGNLSGAGTISIDGYFSSTYLNYRIIFDSIQTDTDDSDMNIRVNTSGSADTSSNYYYASTRTYLSSGANAVNSEKSAWGNDKWILDDGLEDNTNSAVFDLMIYNPQSTAVTKVMMAKYWNLYSNGAQYNIHNIGMNWNSTTALTGVTIFLNSGNFETSSDNSKNNWTLYGYKN